MAYNKQSERKHWDMRALPLAVGALTKHKRDTLQDLFQRVVALMKTMADECFSPEPLRDDDDTNSIEKRLIALQKSEPFLNAVWAEKARMLVKPALEESNKRYFKKLAGSLRFVDSTIPKDTRTPTEEELQKQRAFIGPPAPARLYFHVPLAIQSEITETDLAKLKSVGEATGEDSAIALFRRVVIQGDVTGLSPHQLTIIRAIHARAQEQHSMPAFDARDNFTLQLHLDYRTLPTVKRRDKPDEKSAALQLRDGEAFLVKDDTNIVYRRFLAISGVAPHAPRVLIPVSLSKKIAKRLEGTNPDWASLIVELCQHDSGTFQVGVRLVCGKPQEAPTVDLTRVTAIVGRDFGFANTIALSVALSDTPIDLSDRDSDNASLMDTKEAAKAFYTSHSVPSDVKIVEHKLFDGHPFLKKINQHATRIDQYKSTIDLAYHKLNALHGQVFSMLALSPDDRIDAGMKHSVAGGLVREFFWQLGRINDLKKARRALYRRIAALKKCWFGYLNNVEVALSRKYHAILVREDLTITTIEREDSGYKGRTFNKMINHGSKGQYQKLAMDKLGWNGIPERTVPSFYTSRACCKHAIVVGKSNRKGESIFLPCCNHAVHADVHASETLACTLFLRPVLPLSGSPIRDCEKHIQRL